MEETKNRIMQKKSYGSIERSASGSLVKSTEEEKYNDDFRAFGTSELLSETCPPQINKDEEKDKGEKIPSVGLCSLFRYASAFDKFLMVIGVIVAIISGASMPAVQILFGQVLNQLIDFDKGRKNLTNATLTTDEFLKNTAYLCMLNAIIGVVFFVTNYMFITFFSLAAANQAFRIRCFFMQSIIKQDIGWFDTNETGDFASRITGDLNRIQDGIGEKIGICISNVSSTVFGIGCGLYYGWKLALVILSITPVLTIAMAVMSKIQASVAREELQVYGMAGAVAEEVLSAIRTVVAFGGEKKEIQRYENCLNPAKKKGIKRGLMTSIGSGLMWFCIFAGYALAFWYGLKLILESQENGDDKYNGGTLITVFFNIMSASMFIGQTAPYFEAFAIARGAAAKIYSIIDRQPFIDSSSLKGKMPPSIDGNIRLHNVIFKYPSRPTVPILQGLSFDVNPGETVALVGPSGCGKSTVIQLILRYYDTNGGHVQIDDNDVKDLNVGWLRDHIGLVGQEPVLFSTTIEENIKLGKSNAIFDEVINAAKLANAHDFIDSLPLKYGTLVGERGAQLSGGQKQRIAIARALIKNPRILLLDEATSALDTESEAVVQKALDQASSGRTTIVVAHRLSTIRNANKIIVLSHGIVHESGTHDELMEMKGLYYQLVEAQLKQNEDNDLDNIDLNSPELQSAVSLSKEHGDDKISAFYQTQISTVSSNLERQLSSTRNETISDEECKEDTNQSAPSQTRLLKISAPELPYAVVGALSALIMGIHFPLFGIIFGNIFEILGEELQVIKEKYVYYCLIFVLMAVTSFLFAFLQTFMFSVAGERLTCRLRKMIFSTIITQDISFFDRPDNSVGSLCSRLTSDASSVQGVAGSRISAMLQAFSTLVTAIVIGLYFNYKIGLVVLAFVPLLLLAAYLEGNIIKRQSAGEKSALEVASKVAIEAIESIRTVAALHQEDSFYNHFYDALLIPHVKSRIKSHIRGLSYGFGHSIQSFANATAFYYGTRLVGYEDLPYGDLIKVMQGVIVGTSTINQAIAFTPDYQKAKIAAARIFKLLDLKPQIDVFLKEGLTRESIKGNISFKKVHFNYPSRPGIKVLRDLDLEVEPGKTVALVGSSGCGKSTCVQLIERFYDAQQGKVLIDDEDIKDLNVANHRSHLGLVSQEPVLFSYSIAQNIAYGDNSREPDMNEIILAARKANIHNFVSSLPKGYETPVGDKGAQLSGGQKQRVAIARALLRNPKILLLDEATSALDAESEKVVQEALDKARSGRTCLVIAHRLNTIQNADLIVVIHKGRIVEKGTHQELLNLKGYYYKLYNIQS